MLLLKNRLTFNNDLAIQGYVAEWRRPVPPYKRLIDGHAIGSRWHLAAAAATRRMAADPNGRFDGRNFLLFIIGISFLFSVNGHLNGRRVP